MRISRKFMLAMVVAIICGPSADAQQPSSRRDHPWSALSSSKTNGNQQKSAYVPATRKINNPTAAVSRHDVSAARVATATPNGSQRSIKYSNPAVVVKRFNENPVQHKLTDSVTKAVDVAKKSDVVESVENVYLDLEGNVIDAKTFASLATESVTTKATAVQRDVAGVAKKTFTVPSFSKPSRKKPKLVNPLSLFSKKKDRPIRFAPDVLLPKAGQFPTSIEDRDSLFANTLPRSSTSSVDSVAYSATHSAGGTSVLSQPQSFDATSQGSVWEPMPVDRTASQRSSAANSSDFNPY